LSKKRGNGEGSIYPVRDKNGNVVGYRGSFWVHTADGPKRRYLSGKRREDVAEFREVFARALGRALAAQSFDVAFVGAGTISEARALLREVGTDAALVDVRLPGGDRLDLVRELNNGNGGAGRIPTLVLTAYLDHRVAARAMDAGAQGALSKDLSVPETAGAIMRLLDGGPSEA
jgi:DNA-binding NarL/FixJ family response regulator